MNRNGKIEIVFGLSLFRKQFYNIGFLFNKFCGLVMTANSHDNGPYFISSDLFFNLNNQET